MKRLLSTFSCLFVLLSHTTATACPDGAGGRHGKRFERLDANKDEKLSRDEVKDARFLSDRFDEVDSDKDSFLTKEEVKAHHEAHRPSKMPAPAAE